MTAVTIINKNTAATVLAAQNPQLLNASVVQLELLPQQIKGMERVGNDLIIKLASGEAITVFGFFTQFDGHSSSLVLSDQDGKLWLADIQGVQGELQVVYSEIDSIEPLMLHDDNAAWGLIPFILGGAAMAAVAADKSDDSGPSNPPPAPPYQAPAAPKFEVKPNADGTVNVQGQATPGHTVTVTFPDGSTQSTLVDQNGNFFVDSQNSQTNGDVVANAKDPAGNVSDDARVPYLKPPEVEVVENDDGTIRVEGQADPGAEVTVTFPDGGKETVTADADGKFSVDSDSPQTDGDVVVNYTDGAGNTSPDTTVPYEDETPPKAPSINLQVNPDGTLNVSGEAEVGSEVTVTFPDGTQSTVTAGTDGKYSVNSAERQDSGEVEAFATDKAGNPSDKTKETFDAKAPNTAGVTLTINDVAGDGVINAEEAAEPTTTLTGTLSGVPADAVTALVVVTVNGQDYDAVVTAGVWSVNVPTMELVTASETKVYAEVTLTNAEGYSSSLETSRGYTVDTQAPDTTGVGLTINAVAGNDIINAEEAAELTTTLTGTLSGVPADAVTALVVVTVNGQDYDAVVTAGVWSVNVPTMELVAAADAKVYAEVTLTDAAGNSSEVDASRGYAVDTQAPDTTGVGLTINAVAGNDIINAEEAAELTTTLTGTLSGVPADAVTALVVVTVNGQDYDAVVTAGVWSANVPTTELLAASDAKVYAEVTLTDAAGNSSAVDASRGYTVDTQAPDITGVGLTINAVAGNDIINAEEAAELTTTLTGTLSGVPADAVTALVVVTVNGQDYDAVVTAGVWSVNVPTMELVAAADAKVYAEVTLTDAAGNSSAVDASRGYAVDTQAPDAPSVNLITNPNGSVTVSGEAEAESTVTVTFPDGKQGSAIADSDGKYSVTSNDPQNNGEVVANTTDKAGNKSGDTKAPYLKPPVFEVTENSDGTIRVEGEAEPGSEVHITFPDGETETVIAGPDGSFSTDSKFPQIDGDVVVDYTDGEGNTSPETTVPYEDKQPPQAPTINPNPPVANADGTLTVSGRAEVGSEVTVKFPDGSEQKMTVGADSRYSLTSDLPQNNGDVVAYAVDKAANKSAETTVPYLKAPDFSLNSNSDGTVLVEGDAAPDAEVRVTFPDGSTQKVSADSDGKFSVVSQNPQGSGNVVVNYTDTAGNNSPTSTEPFVDITDPDAPSVELALNPDGTLNVSGEAEVGSEVTVTFPDGTTKTTQVGNNGQYSLNSDAPQNTGEVAVNAKDKAGNISDDAKELYLKAPDFTASSSGNSNGIVVVEGDAAPNAEVLVTFPDGQQETVTAGADGKFSVSSSTPQINGDIVVNYDFGGKTSPDTQKPYIDSTPPQAPTINLAVNPDGTLNVSGQAEADSTVHVTFPDGTQTTVNTDATGQYSANSQTRQDSGDVKAYAVDRAGNQGAPASETFEINGPDTTGIVLNINPVAGDNVINIAEADSPTTVISGTVTGPFSTVAESVVVNFMLDGTRYSAQVAADGSWSAVVNTDDLLANEPREVAANAVLTNEQGYSSTVSQKQSYAVDVDVQYITITAVTGDGLINQSESAEFAISGTTTVEEGRAVTVVITDSSNPAMSLTLTTTVDANNKWRIEAVDVSDLADGTLTLDVSTTNSSGNPATTSRDAILDTMPPDVTGVTLEVRPIAGDDVINKSDSEQLTTTISGTLSDVPVDVVAQSVMVTIDGTTYTAKLQADGSWSVAVPTQALLDAADNKVVAVATLTDAAGNSNTLDAPRGYSVQLSSTDTITMALGADFVDTLPPESVEPDVTLRETLSTDKYTSDTAFTLAPMFTAGVQNATYQYSYNGGEWITLGSALASTGYQVDLASGSAARGDGVYSFRAIGADMVGNTVESDTVSVTIDTKAPTGTQIYAAGSKLVMGTAEAGSWVALDYSFNGTGVDAYARTSETAAADGKYYWTYEAAFELATSGTVVAIAFDKAGNASAPSSALGIDTSAPTLTLNATDGMSISGTVGDLDTPYPSASETAPITITVQVQTDPGQPATTYTVRVTADGAWSLTLPQPLPMGATVTAVAKDAAGNTSPTLSVGVGGEVSNVEGATNWGLLGWDVRSAGDFNGDGFEDFVMVAPHASHSSPQNNANLWEAYLIYGSAAGLPTNVDLSNLKGTEGIKIYTSASIADANVLAHVNGHGDINGDGYDDLVLSDDNVDSGYVIMGRATPTSEDSVSIDVKKFQGPNGAADADGFGLFRDGGPAWVGLSATIADVNNDGYADIAITTDRSNAGVHIIYGHEGAAGSAAWQNYGIGNNIVTDYNGKVSTRPFNSIETGSSANFGVTGLGDINGDGFQDFAWGSQGNNTVTVMYGGVGLNSDGTLSNIPAHSNLSNSLISYYTTNSEGRGFRLTNVELERVGDDALNSRSTLTHPIASGDFNGDGIADIVVGAGAAGGTSGYAGQGQVYVIFGTEGGLSGDIDVRTLAANGTGFSILSPTYSTSNRRYDSFGRSVAMGDFNGDGIDDIALGAPLADNGGNNNGSVFIIYGKAGAPATFGDITAGVSGTPGQAGSMERIDGTESSTSTSNNTGNNAGTFGSTLGAGVTFGDFNGDGIADLGIGSPYQNGDQPRGGHVDVLYGSPQNMTQSYTAGDDVLVGTAGIDRLSGGAGNDVLTNIGTGDVAYGGQGNDLIAITSTDFVRVDGNEGMNTLRVDSTEALNIDFAALGMKVQNFNVIDLGAASSTENGDHTVQLRLSDVMTLTQGQTRDSNFQPLRIQGDAGDTVRLQASYKNEALSGTQTVDGVIYNVYHHTPDATDPWSGSTFADVWVQQGVVVQNYV